MSRLFTRLTALFDAPVMMSARWENRKVPRFNDRPPRLGVVVPFADAYAVGLQSQHVRFVLVNADGRPTGLLPQDQSVPASDLLGSGAHGVLFD